MSVSRYSHRELKNLIDQMLTIYDMVRLVDPNECRIVHLNDEEEKVIPGEECYHVWDSNFRCSNCSSYRAEQSASRTEKYEVHKDSLYHVLSVPVEYIDSHGTANKYVMECITINALESPASEAKIKAAYQSDRNMIDSLTGLYNWEGFYETSRRLIDDNKDEEWVVLVYDIIKFKLVNDILGMDKGNEVLMNVGRLLSSKLQNGEICGRLRADQFALLIHKSSFDDKFAISLSKELPDLIRGVRFHLHLQAGVYFVSDKAVSVSTMCDRATIALSTIKGETGVHLAIFNESIMEKMLKEQYIIDECERAIREGEFKMYLQPQVSEEGRIIGAEALSRWVRPTGEVVPPSDFIEILEKSEQIAKLDVYVWEAAAKQLAEWKETDKSELYISVNVSPKDFFYVDVYDVFDALIKKYNIDKGKLKLEITETFMMKDTIRQLALVDKLHNDGFEIEIDDFGKGYSSLSLLKDINADTLKIDKEFLRETDNDKKSENILGSVIEMSDKLNMNVITEGVETREQLEKLLNLGCHTFQGFYFAKPMTLDSFEEIWGRNGGNIVH